MNSKNKKKSQIPTWTKTDRAYQYADAVDSGEIIAGPIVRGACRRFINDVDKFLNDSNYKYYYDYKCADETIQFFEKRLVLSGGQFEGLPFILLDWQAFIIGNLFGWKKRENKFRRFRTAYVETPKGSGKSPLAAGIGLKGLCGDKEPFAEIYAAATKQDQAMVLFRDAVSFYDKSPELQKRLKASGTFNKRWELYNIKNDSFFRVISSEKKGLSGPRPHFILLDEIHEHSDGTVIEMLDAGIKFRRQPLTFMITNSGTDKTSVCFEYHESGRKVACELEQDDEFFAYICSFDDDDLTDEKYLYDESLWEKVNPSLKKGIPGYDYIRGQVKKAEGIPSKMSTVKRLCFCLWVESANPWIDSDVWFSCRDENFDESELVGRRCWGGLDLSRVNDLTAAVFVFEPSGNDPFWRVVSRFWIPGLNLQHKIDQDHVPYDVWLDQGHINTTPTKMIKKSYVAREIQAFNEKHNLMGLAYDRAMVNDFFQAAEDEGVNLNEGKWDKEEKNWKWSQSNGVKIMPFGQSAQSMHPAIEKFEGWLKNGEVKHNGNPCLTWCAANAVVKEIDSYRRLSKKESTGRIDGIIAAVMACGVADHNAVEKKSVYEERGLLAI